MKKKTQQISLIKKKKFYKDWRLDAVGLCGCTRSLRFLRVFFPLAIHTRTQCVIIFYNIIVIRILKYVCECTVWWPLLDDRGKPRRKAHTHLSMLCETARLPGALANQRVRATYLYTKIVK